MIGSRYRRAGMAVPAGAFLVGAWLARRPRMTATERRSFEAVNALSPRGFAPVWVLMQAGSLAGALAAGVLAAALAGGRAGRQVALAGTVAWAGAKAVKPFVRRGRPGSLIERARVLGRPQAGLGYPSGHAAVAAAVSTVAVRHVPARWRLPVRIAGLAVGPTRIYVGAHLPLDVAGGAALGLAVAAAVR